MEMYRETIGKQSTLILSTDSEIYKFLKSSDPEIKGSDPTQRAAHSPVIPHVVPLSHE